MVRRSARSRLALRPLVLALALVSLAPTAALAETVEEPDAPAMTYEESRLALALGEAGLVLDPAPDGKRIRRIHYLRRDVLADDEFLPTFFNAFHWLTHEETIAREVLFAPGEAYDPATVAETTRNLRAKTIFAIVRVVPVRAADMAPDEVDVAVFTRDLWSLRLETGFQVTDGHLDALRLTLIERNFLGRAKQAALRFALLPATWSIGEAYYDPRVLGGALALTQSFDLVFARADGELEGSYGALSFGIPLRDLAQAWGFEVSVAYEDVVGRQLSGSELLTWDNPDTSDVEAIPRIWDQTVVTATAGVLAQTGDALKHRFDVGLGASVSDRAPHARAGLGGDAAARAAFERDVLPPDRRQVYPYVAYKAFTPTYVVLHDLAAYGISEDVRTGPSLDLFAAAPFDELGSDADALIVTAKAAYVLSADGGLLDAMVGAQLRLQLGEVTDQVYEARLRGATPTLPFGRIAARAHWEGRVADSASTLVTLGGDNGLRGYPAQAFYGFGANRLRLNVELRTPPFRWSFAHVGAVCFWDGGAVYDGVANFELHQSVGLGIRFLLPQFNRYVFRVDLGVPLDGEGFRVLVSFGSQQAVPLTAAEDLLLEE